MQTTGAEATSAPHGAMALDASALLRYMRAAMAPQLPAGTRALRVRQFGHGQSNPTYLVECLASEAEEGRSGAAAPPPLASFVLRKKPPGKLLASAHAVEREFAVLSALGRANAGVPVPAVYALCTDASVLGTPFYVMQHVVGRIFLDPALPSLTPSERGVVYDALAATLAALHRVSPSAVGLGAFGGRAGGVAYAARQAERWAAQYDASCGAGAAMPPAEEAATMRALAQWLRAHAPRDDATLPVRIVHGDYRLDNIVFHPTELRVVAVLDWELATLGDPLADVAYACLPYHLPRTAAAGAGVPALPPGPPPPGVPSEAALRAAYARALGAGAPQPGAPPATSWEFYLALSLFRLASILAGVRARAAAGNAAARNAAAVGGLVGELARRAAQLAALPVAADNHNVGAVDAGLMPVPPRVAPLLTALRAFMASRVYPAEAALHAHARSEQRWTVHPLIEELKAAARAAGLWNLWLPADSAALLRVPAPPGLLGPGLSNAEYAPLAELMGRSPFAPEVFNCSAPDTGNMEVLLRYGTAAQQQRWLLPLLDGKIRSCFAMTEPGVASSDATNIAGSIVRDGAAHLLLRGVKWWTSGACDPRCSLAIFMGKSAPPGAPAHAQQSMVLVPMDAPGVAVLRPLTVYGYDDAPHGHAEVAFRDVRVLAEESLLLGDGRGFEIAQGRLGPGRLHHCMRLIGAAGRGLELARARASARVAFGKPVAAHGAFASDLARCRLVLEQARLVTLAAAAALDAHGNKAAAGAIAMAKLAAPAAACQCLDFAVQAHGAAGVCDDTPLAYLWAAARTLRIADGPDDVHLATLAKLEMRGKARL